MRPTCDALAGEVHQQARHAQTMEPPTATGPAPSSDKETNSDPGRQELWGQKNQNNFWICFQNIRGLIPESGRDLKLQVLLQYTQQHQINVFGFAEHNICWDMFSKNQQVIERTHSWWENSHWITSFNKHDTHPIAHQPGRTGIVVLNALSHKALKPGGDDEGLGQWSWVHL